MQTTNTKSTTNNYTIFITTNHPSFQKCYMYFSPLVKPNKAEVRARFLHIDTWISQSCCMEYSKLLHLSKLIHVFLAPCQTKPSKSFTKISQFTMIGGFVWCEVLPEVTSFEGRFSSNCWFGQSSQWLGLLCLWQCFINCTTFHFGRGSSDALVLGKYYLFQTKLVL